VPVIAAASDEARLVHFLPDDEVDIPAASYQSGPIYDAMVTVARVVMGDI